jgi:hypothetical protein
MAGMRKIGITLLAAGAAALSGAFAGAESRADASFRGDLTHRPRLAFDARDTAHLSRTIARIHAREEPWAGGYEALRNLAETGVAVDHRTSGWASQPDPWEKLYGREGANGRIAAAKAATAWLWSHGLDPAWRPVPRLPGQASAEGWCRAQAAEAARIIERMYEDWPCWRGFSVINRGIVAADSLATHGEAYDMLAALPASLRPALGTAEEKIAELASDLDYWHFTVDAQDNNHGIRVASGLGIAAITLNRHDRYRWWKPWTAWYRPSGWIAKAEHELHPSGSDSDLRFQLSTGGYAEGTSYYAYASDLTLPFFFGYARFQQGGGVPFLRSDLVTSGARWGMDLRLPDGRRPAIDNSSLHKDATQGFFLSQAPGGVRSAADQTSLLWDFEGAGRPGTGGGRALALLAAYDPPPAVVAAARAMTSPWGAQPTRFLDAQGAAVLRSGPGADAAYALVVAEHGDARTRGLGHDSVDQGAYTFYARGDLVTIDPGYAGFSEVERTHRGEHRSMVLVDGKAAKPAHQPLGFLPWVAGAADARLVAGPRTQAGAAVRSAEVATAYEGAAIRRTVALVEERYLLVEDRCAAGSEKTFTTQVQTNGGAAKGRPLQVSGATVRYETRAQRVKVCVGAAASAALSVATAAGFDRTGDGGPDGHDAIKYSARGRSVTFLTAIAADAQGGAAPAVEAVAASGGALALRVEAGGRVDIAISNPAGASVSVAAQPGTRAITTDAEVAVVSFDAAGAASVLARIGGTHASVAAPAPAPTPQPAPAAATSVR